MNMCCTSRYEIQQENIRRTRAAGPADSTLESIERVGEDARRAGNGSVESGKV